MIALPFVWFLIMFFVAIRRKGFDVYAYIILLYLVISFFSILFDANNLYSSSSVPPYTIGFIAPIVYCVLLTICFLPFKRFDSNKIRYLVNNINIKAYNWVVYIFFGIFVLFVLVSVTKIQEIMAAQSLAALRMDAYKGENDNVWTHFTGWQRYVIAGLALFVNSCRILIVFFFINVIYLKKSIWFNLMTLMGSMSGMLLSIYTMDRSTVVYWILLFIAFFIIFKNNLKFKDIKPYFVAALPFAAIVVVYFVGITISRFGEENGGNVWDAVFVYAGQSFLSFCGFFNYLGDAPKSLQPFFPLTYELLGLPNYFEQAEIVESYYHYGVSNFSTFLGYILSICGKLVMFVFVLFFYMISTALLRRKNKSYVTIKQYIYFLLLGLIPVNGIFTYAYFGYQTIFIILIWIFISKIVTRKGHNFSLIGK